MTIARNRRGRSDEYDAEKCRPAAMGWCRSVSANPKIGTAAPTNKTERTAWAGMSRKEIYTAPAALLPMPSAMGNKTGCWPRRGGQRRLEHQRATVIGWRQIEGKRHHSAMAARQFGSGVAIQLLLSSKAAPSLPADVVRQASRAGFPLTPR